jgi:dienelactone hydrolase
MSTEAAEHPFARRTITFADGTVGRRVVVASANPRNYHQLVAAPDAMAPVELDGLLFAPASARGPLPVVVIVPGSLSVAPSHVRHAADLVTRLGVAAFVLDTFTGRGVTSTVANQAQFSFAASAYDLVAATRALRAESTVDVARMAWQGHSRGGTAVLLAAQRALTARAAGPDLPAPRGVLAAYPWCGHQPVVPSIGATVVRVLHGDRDEWCSAQQAQGFVQAMRLAGGDASIRIVAGAQHSFDRDEPVHDVPEASVSPGAPTAYFDASGAFVHPVTGEADAALVDRDLFVYNLQAGYGRRGAGIGGTHDEAVLFTDEMLAFHGRVLG